MVQGKTPGKSKAVRGKSKALKAKTPRVEVSRTLTTKVFKSGNSQAVRIPKEFQFEVEEVEIFKQGNEVVLRPKKLSLADLLRALPKPSDDFFAERRHDPPPEQRESLNDI
jgi:antitoxin VapB